MKGLIQTNARIIGELHGRIRSTFANRSKSDAAYDEWKQACAEFHERYNSLAFPGGLEQALQKLKAGDMLTAESAICFLEIHPYFFRSQYISTKLIRLLKKLPLPANLRCRLDSILAAARDRKRKS
jgi:hypothetical protein